MLNRRSFPLVAMGLSAFLWACGGGDTSETSDAETPNETSTEQPQEQAGLDLSNVQLPEGVTAGMVNSGAELYPTQACTACHMADATGGPLAPDLTDDEWINIDGEFEQIIQVITEGIAEPIEYPSPMLARGGTTMTDDQIRDVAAYVYAISRGAS